MKLFLILSLLLIAMSSFAEAIHSADFVGYQSCRSCHQKEVKDWQNSHHNKAMQHASNTTVLGDFNQAHFENYGLTTTFFKKEDQFWINTDGPDGQLHDYQIKYTFGFYPLQQYLIEFPGGRLQALDIAWDSRPFEQGGQHWYHLHPDEKIDSNDIIHWTGPNLNWNYMCAFCHSTNLEKNYKSETNTYETSWSEINVSCEACHGPASKHIEWAKLTKNDVKMGTDNKNMGLTNTLNERKYSHWSIDKITQKPLRSSLKSTNTEIETCARCHSRRTQLGKDNIHKPLMDVFRPARLSSNLYFADGQPKDEVYVYGSFIQSKMYHAGVTCSDCHNPHTNQLKFSGDQVCNQCHVPAAYRSESHHFHKTKTIDSISCLDCHMPATTFMGVDERNDHSFRIPRPDLSKNTDIPNACNKCHITNTPQWAEEHLKDWYKKRPVGKQKFAAALYAQHQQHPSAEKRLYYLINDNDQPDIARATALEELSNYPNQQSKDIIAQQLKSNNPMTRLAALEALSTFDQRTQITSAFPFIYDRLKSIRMETARLLVSFPKGQLSDKDKKQLQLIKQEYINSQLFNAERPESQVNLGNYYFQLDNFKKAENAYNQAIQLQPQFIPAYLNLNQLYSKTDNEEKGELILKRGLDQVTKSAELHHMLGLSYIRQNKNEQALLELQSAADMTLDNIQYQYIYAVALNSFGQSDKAISILKHVHSLYSVNTEILIALITFSRDQGYDKEALNYANKLKQLRPRDQSIENLILDLTKKVKY